jgi:lipopolysaccharide export LptBFGC system permease protein LptF
MRTLDRLVLGTFLKLFVTFALGAPILFVLGDVTDKLDNYLALGVTWSEAAQAYLFMYPRFIYWSFPIAAMIAAVFTVHGMTTNREILAAKAGGISFRRLTFPLFLLGAVLSVAAYGLSEVAPRFDRRAADLLRGAGGIRTGDIRSRFVFKESRERTLSADLLTASTGFLDNPRYEVVGEGGVVRDIVGDRGTYSEEGWTFHEGVARSPRAEEQPGLEFSFAELLVRDIDLTPDQLQQRRLDDLEMTREELLVAANNLRGSGVTDTNKAREYLVERELRWALAGGALVIIIFGAPVATSVKRGGTAFGIGISLGATVVYMLLLRLAKAFGTIGLVDPVVAAWAPNAAFLLVGLILLVRVRT